MTTDSVIDRSAPVYVAGHAGLVGSAIVRHLRAQGFTEVRGLSRAELDLRDRAAVFEYFATQTPELIFLAAARVGGILANSQYPAQFLSDNLQIQTTVMDAAHAAGVPRLVFLGSSCIYPKMAPQPIREEYLLTGPFEPTNDAYAIAKVAGLMQVQAMRRQYGHRWISLMPTNIYGPGDNFDLQTAHVLPALLRRFAEAEPGSTVTLWGSGTPRREFLHSDDLARACLFAAEHYDGDLALNVGTGQDIAIADLAQLIADTAGFTGTIAWDPARPDGTPRKLLDVSRLAALGWRPEVPLVEGIASTYAWFTDPARRAAEPTVPHGSR